MELFLPGLIVLVISALFAFFIIPRTGALILAVVCMIALIAAGINHYNTFYAEYQLSTWQNGLKENAIFVILGLAILAIIGSIFYMFSGGEGGSNVGESPMETLQNAVVNAAANMPPANTATNPLTGAINSGLKSMMNAKAGLAGATGAVTGAVSGAANAVTNAFKGATSAVTGAFGGNTKPPTSPVISGVGVPASGF